MPLTQWWNFFYLCGSSSATLTGLTFVAVSLGSALIKKDNLEQVRVFLSPICFHFLHVFFLCSLMAIPEAGDRFLANAIILSVIWRAKALPKTYAVVRAQAKKEDGDVDYTDWITLVLLPIAVYLVLLATGVGFWLDKPWAIDTLAISCLTLLLGSAKAAWETILWVAATIT